MFSSSNPLQAYHKILGSDFQGVCWLDHIKDLILHILNAELWTLPTGQPHPKQIFEELVHVNL